jgi:2-phosphoglycerate kinase
MSGHFCCGEEEIGFLPFILYPFCMLYLIGGSPRCGKTTFSKMLAYEKRISWFSTDLAATIIRPYLSEEDGNAFFRRWKYFD